MKKGKKLLALLLSAALTAAALGCGNAGKGTGGQDAPNADSNQESAPQDMAGENDKDGGTAGDGANAGSVTSMGRYMESSFALPEDAAVSARTLTLLADDRLAYFDSDAGMYFSEDEGKSWKKYKKTEELIPDRQIGYICAAAVASDASVALCEISFVDDELSDAIVSCVDPSGTRVEADGMVEEGGWISKVAFGPDGSLYAADMRGKIYEIDRTSGERRLLFSGTMRPEVLAFTGKLLLTLEESGVEIYNLETGALQESDPVLNDFCREKLTGKLGANSDSVGGYLLGAQEGIVYLACSEGLFRHVLGGSAMEQLIEGNFSTFGDPVVGICNVLLLETDEFLLLGTGTELIRFTYDPNEPTVPEKQLKVYSLEENSRLRQAISAYQKEYPDVYVSYETGMSEGSAFTRVDALKNLNLSLMGGDGPDVLLLDGIDQTPYVRKGMLKDLSGILESLTEENAVFENIAGAYRTGEGTYVLPSGFVLPLILGKAEDIGTVTDLASLADLTEKLSAGIRDYPVTGAVTAEQELTQLLSVCSPSWLTDGELDEAALEEFLVLAKRMYDADRTGVTPEFLELYGSYDGPVPLGSRITDMMIGTAEIAFGNASMMLLDVGGISYYMEEEEGYAFRLWGGQDGAGFVPMNKLAVSSGTVRTEEAENFVRLMFSEQVQSVNMGSCFPVNRAAFDELCVWKDQWVGGSAQLPDGEVEFGNGWPSEETAEQFRELVEQADRCLDGNAVVEEAVLKYGPQVLSGVMSAQQGVQEIKKAVAIYLAEQG